MGGGGLTGGAAAGRVPGAAAGAPGSSRGFRLGLHTPRARRLLLLLEAAAMHSASAAAWTTHALRLALATALASLTCLITTIGLNLGVGSGLWDAMFALELLVDNHLATCISCVGCMLYHTASYHPPVAPHLLP